jgi:hypothetical protein
VVVVQETLEGDQLHLEQLILVEAEVVVEMTPLHQAQAVQALSFFATPAHFNILLVAQ